MSVTTAGRLERIWIKRARRGPMDATPAAALRSGTGIVGNADQGGKRQVTLIETEAWGRAQQDLGAAADPVLRRANLLVSGIELRDSGGRILRIGAVRIRIGGETAPCRLMDELHPGLQRALRPEWRAGAFGEVLDDGAIAVGDTVAWEPADAPR